MKFGNERMPTELLTASPEAIIHDFFRDHFNYFDVLEQAAEALRQERQANHMKCKACFNRGFLPNMASLLRHSLLKK